MQSTSSMDKYIAVASKEELEGSKKINELEKKYIIRYVELLNSDYNLLQAENKVSSEFGFML